MAVCFQISPSVIKSQFCSNPFSSQFYPKKPTNFFRICCSQSGEDENPNSNATSKQQKKLSQQSSWESKDSEGKDYLYRLGAEADNMNIAVGARAGVIDDLFAGNFLGKDSDIVFDYRQKVTRSFEYLQGDYYIAPFSWIKLVRSFNLRIWGGKGQGKTFQTELIFRALGVEPIIMSAGELESEKAGNTQMTVNNQIVVGTLMNISDNPTRVSIGQAWREADVTNRVPVIVTGNDFTTIYAPLIRDGRMDKFYWQPTQEDIVNIVHRMYEKDGITKDEVVSIVSEFPNQALDFYGALRSRTYDRSILKWVNDAGGAENLGSRLLKQKKEGKLPVFTAPEQTLEALLESGYDLIREQKLIMETKLSKEYMKNMDD
ncbi:UNVERIFIED_CONTAM: Ribulose bisphosphate carboxylase/oxygenase activase, chloroplastic [Sesamum calycinum]|uniref:Ribulose bisphosphate carboxylase/oxygenase activase, chloroplastic n=1 Tax=Sesamum calycinum TaxID=2727403 RepID=A0AAW2NGB9_9LAMI